MARMANRIETALLGNSSARPLREVNGYNWLQHLGMASLMDDRRDLGGSLYRCKLAARSYVASLQLLSGDDGRQWFHLSADRVRAAVHRYMLPTRKLEEKLFDTVYERFRFEVVKIMAEVNPTMERLSGVDDLSMLSNVYLNSVDRMSPGAGVYFVHVDDDPNFHFVDVEVYPPKGFQRFLGAIRGQHLAPAVSEVAAYYSILLSQYRSGNVDLSSEELRALEEHITEIMGLSRDAGAGISLAESLDVVESIETPRRLAFSP